MGYGPPQGSGGGGAASNLSAVLAAGNASGANDINMASGQSLKWNNDTFIGRGIAKTLNLGGSQGGQDGAIIGQKCEFVDQGSGKQVDFDFTSVGALTLSSGAALALQASSKITQYNGVNTAGLGIPIVVASARAVAVNAAQASVATFTPAADGSFMVSVNVLVTTATTHTFTCECAYTDEGNTARVLTMSFTLVAGGVFTTSIANGNGAVPYMGIPQMIRAKGGTAVTLRTQAAGTYTTVTFNVEGLIQQVA